MRKKSTPRVTSIQYNRYLNWSKIWDGTRSMYLISLRLITVQAYTCLPRHLCVFGTGRPNWRRICHPPLANDLGQKFALYFLAVICLAAKLRIWALSFNSDRKSRWVLMFWRFWTGSYNSRRSDGSPISTGIMASAPYTRLKGDLFVADWGVHL